LVLVLERQVGKKLESIVDDNKSPFSIASMNVQFLESYHKASVAAQQAIVAEELGSDAEFPDDDDVIPGPPTKNGVGVQPKQSSGLDLSTTKHSDNTLANMKGKGMLASRKDLSMPSDEFAEGCKLLQQSALGNEDVIKVILKKRPHLLNFRDYDRRTALHVAASEGHVIVCKLLVEKGAKVNRSDRWGGSPLDDAHRHRHQEVIVYLRQLGASSGTTNNMTNFITAAADGDVDEVKLLLTVGEVNVDQGDYDKRTALHLAAGEGKLEVVELLCRSGADPNVEDRWGNRPLDDAIGSKQNACAHVLKTYGGERSSKRMGLGDSSSRRRETANFEVAFEELDMIDRIGKGKEKDHNNPSPKERFLVGGSRFSQLANRLKFQQQVRLVKSINVDGEALWLLQSASSRHAFNRNGSRHECSARVKAGKTSRKL
jgi:hypothetical protein